MSKNLLSNSFSRLAAIGAKPGDSDEIKLQKSILVVSAIPFIIAGIIWGIMYISLGEATAGLIPLSYSVVSLISLVIFSIKRKFRVFRFSQLLFILLLPFALMIALGGFINGSAVILWAVICPLGAMLFDKQSNAPKWLVAFIGIILISLLIKPWLRTQNNLTEEQINMFFVINLIAVCAIIFLMVYYFVSRKNFFQERSDRLLLNILPSEIAEELKNTGKVAAKHFDDVTVMFTDFKDFTQISEKLSPDNLVSELDFLFKAFDKIICRHNLEKIKTIGDSYMCAGGLPTANKTHAHDVVNAALELQKFMEMHSQNRKSVDVVLFEIRIGIHTGPVTAGVVGENKFAYDIWGDTVNIASRLESSGEAGKINISRNTYELVKEKFKCVHRGKVKAKNKGEIDMYFVIGKN